MKRQLDKNSIQTTSPCIECVYYKYCGSDNRHVPCASRETNPKKAKPFPAVLR